MLIELKKAIYNKCNPGWRFSVHHFVLKKILLVIISVLLLSGIGGCTRSSGANIVPNQQDTTTDISKNSTPSGPKCYGNSMGNILNNGLLTRQVDTVVSGVNYRLDVINEKTGQRTTITDDVPLFLNLVNNTIYYVNSYPENWDIYRINIDGSDKRKLTNERTECMIVIDDWIYYSVVERIRSLPYKKPDYTIYSIYRIKNDGSQKNTLYSGRAEGSNNTILGRFFIYDDWIYYTNISDEYKLYKTKIDGSKTIKVIDESFMNEALLENQIFIDNGWIYYIQANDNYKVYRMRTDGSDRNLVIDEPIVRIPQKSAINSEDDRPLVPVNTDQLR